MQKREALLAEHYVDTDYVFFFFLAHAVFNYFDPLNEGHSVCGNVSTAQLDYCEFIST